MCDLFFCNCIMLYLNLWFSERVFLLVWAVRFFDIYFVILVLFYFPLYYALLRFSSVYFFSLCVCLSTRYVLYSFFGSYIYIFLHLNRIFLVSEFILLIGLHDPILLRNLMFNLHTKKLFTPQHFIIQDAFLWFHYILL